MEPFLFPGTIAYSLVPTVPIILQNKMIDHPCIAQTTHQYAIGLDITDYQQTIVGFTVYT
jgi:hypothetical protein